jgi:hypothetical protein
MPIGTVKSVNVTNIEASPTSLLWKKKGEVKLIDRISLATTAMDDVGDIILMGPVRSDAILVELAFYNDALAASGLAYNIGLYYSGIGGNQAELGRTSGTVIDADCIGTAVAFSTARVVPGFVGFEARDIVDITKELWEVGGLASDPGGLFYIGLTCSTVATTPAAGDIVMVAETL